MKRQSEIIQTEFGWRGDLVEKVPPQYQYEKIECYMQGVRDYIKYIKRGYSRPSHLVALDVRSGRMGKEEGGPPRGTVRIAPSAEPISSGCRKRSSSRLR